MNFTYYLTIVPNVLFFTFKFLKFEPIELHFHPKCAPRSFSRDIFPFQGHNDFSSKKLTEHPILDGSVTQAKT